MTRQQCKIPHGWQIKELRDYVIPIHRPVGSRKVVPMSISAGIGFVPQADKFGRDISGKQYEKYTLLKNGEFSYNKGNSKIYPQGCVYQLREHSEVAVPNVFISFKLKDASFNKFFEQFFLANMHAAALIPQINSGVRNNGLLNLNENNFYSIKILTPISILEQQKIVAVLECWDKAIETIQKLIEAKEKQKKALMQKLLTGKVRLKGFKDKWQRRKVGEFGHVITGNTPSMKEKENYGGSFPWATAEDFRGKYIHNTNIKLSSLGKGKARVLPKGSVLITCIASIGLNAIAGVTLSTNQQINAIVPNKYFNSDFIYYLLSFYENYLKKFTSKGSLSILPKGVFEKINFLAPNTQEQIVISEVLSSADKEIDLLKQKLTKLQEQKKGLMQVLLTGQVRLKI